MSIGMAVVPGLIPGDPVMVGALAMIDYVLLLTSSYGRAVVARVCGQEFASHVPAMAFAMLHALFVSDVVAAIVLHMRTRKADGASGLGEGKAAS